MEKANQRIESLKHDLVNLKNTAQQLKDDDDDDDEDELDDTEAIQAEIKALEKENAVRQTKLDEYEKNKKVHICIIILIVEFQVLCATGRNAHFLYQLSVER